MHQNIIGAAWFVNGSSVLHMTPIIITLAFIVLSPLIGLFLGFFLECIFLKIFKNSQRKRVDKIFKVLQHFSTAAFCIGHGSNDAPKTMGIIAVLMASVFTTQGVSDGIKEFIGNFYDSSQGFHIPDILAVVCYIIMSLGILIGGKNVIKTMGGGLAKITPVRGFSGHHLDCHFIHGYPCQYDTHHHGRRHWRRPHRRYEVGEMGHRKAYRPVVDPHYPCAAGHRRRPEPVVSPLSQVMP